MARLGVKVAAIAAAAVLAVAGCGTDRPTQGLAGTAAGGYFTLTGIPEEHEGRFVLLNAAAGYLPVEGWQSFSTEPETATLPRITGGRVRLPMWVVEDGMPVRWYGSITADIAVVMFMEKGELAAGDAADDHDPIGGLFFGDLAFTGGNAQRSFAEGTWHVWE